VIQLLITFLFNIEIFRRASNAFSDVFKATAYPLPKETLRNITKNTISMVAHKTGSIIVSGTDNLLISIYVNIRTVGYYSNYLLFVTTFNTLFGQVYDSLTSSVGDFGNQIDKKKDLIIFRSLNVFNHFSYGIFSSIMIFLVGGFIGLWIGNEYIFENEVMAIIVINLYLYGTRKTSILYINARGLFWNIKWKSIVESIVNLVFSLIFLTLFKMGIFGVLLGTTISTLTTNFWWEPYVVYKDVHEISFVHYLKSLVRPITHNIVSISVLYLLFSNVIYFSYYDLFIRGFVIVLVHSVLWLAFFSGQPEFRFLWEIVVNRVLRVTPMKRK
jgi:O-antigen/teichoic acid export membrane protein